MTMSTAIRANVHLPFRLNNARAVVLSTLLHPNHHLHRSKHCPLRPTSAHRTLLQFAHNFFPWKTSMTVSYTNRWLAFDTIWKTRGSHTVDCRGNISTHGAKSNNEISRKAFAPPERPFGMSCVEHARNSGKNDGSSVIDEGKRSGYDKVEKILVLSLVQVPTQVQVQVQTWNREPPGNYP